MTDDDDLLLNVPFLAFIFSFNILLPIYTNLMEMISLNEVTPNSERNKSKVVLCVAWFTFKNIKPQNIAIMNQWGNQV